MPLLTDELTAAADLFGAQLYDLPPSSTMDVYWRVASGRRLRKRWQYRIKRVFDLATAVFLLVLSIPAFFVIALLIKASSRGPVFYRQARLGRDGQEFRLLKFRTMVNGADQMLDQVKYLNEANGPLFKVTRDPRITRVGRTLRKTFADELPQLINVVRGEMSLVGPRPCLPTETAAMEQQVIFRFAVPQGLTGPWQTNGYHAVTFEERLRIEREYVSSWTLRKDLVIILKTIPLMLQRSGV